MKPLAPVLELDACSFPEWRDGIVTAEANGDALSSQPRTYPGYPRWQLDRSRPRRWGSLDRILKDRRCAMNLATELPSARRLGRLLQMSHGITGPMSAGPVPSAGGLQALELYLVVFEPSWLPAGLYHYDRQGHHLSQLVPEASRADWRKRIPSLDLVQGGSILWVLVGDGERVQRKYGERASKFLLQEAGHLMQNLCLMSASLGLVTVPLGGYLEREVALQFKLLSSDQVVYLGLCGEAGR